MLPNFDVNNAIAFWLMCGAGPVLMFSIMSQHTKDNQIQFLYANPRLVSLCIVAGPLFYVFMLLKTLFEGRQ